MDLLHLPPEVLQLIFLSMSTPSFLQAILTCHMLFDVALISREAILYHLAQIPGIKLGLSDPATPTAELFRTLRRRAALHLYGANINADRTDFTFRKSEIDASASTLASTFASGNGYNVALVIKDSARIWLHKVQSGRVLFGTTALDVPYRDEGVPKVMNVLIKRSHDISALYSRTRLDAGEGPSSDLLFQRPIDTETGMLLQLVHHRPSLDGRAKPRSYWINTASNDSATFHACALYDDGIVAAAWNSTDSEPPKPFVTYYSSVGLPAKAPEVVIADDGSFEDQKVWLRELVTEPARYRRWGRLYSVQSLLRNSPSAGGIARQGIPNPNASDSTSRFFYHTRRLSEPLWKYNMPFFCLHTAYTDLTTGNHHCMKTRLSLVTAEVTGHTIACINCSVWDKVVDVQCSTLSPQESDLDLTLETEDKQTMVARLWGYKEIATTLEVVAAYSQSGRRIAISRWDKIYIWALDPEELIEIHSEEDGESIDYFYDTVDDPNLGTVVELKPVVLEAGAVVHKLEFTADDNVLMSLTSRCLQVWRLGPRSSGIRSVEYLDEDDGGQETMKKKTMTRKRKNDTEGGWVEDERGRMGS